METSPRKFKFLWDNWLGTGNLASCKPQGHRPCNIKVSHFWSTGTWDLQKLNATVPAQMIQFISQVLIHYNPLIHDKPIWKATPSNNFTCASAWNVLKPKTDFVKVNSDGSALNNPGKIGVGVIIRDSEGHFIHAIASPLGEGSNNLVETQAAVLGMQWCLANDITKIHLEADSALLIHWKYDHSMA
ncbi:uncharacterized protein LOC142176453 [Nicotiana tabacum]|uniref:Uncharacterized protein LOC142176453 n=1 Tax=Nicotiana tabacum TaxID=4097 RepID=A0AC58TT24_TOBAC